jgi:hypothetical protein
MSQTLPYTYEGNTGASTAYTYDGIGRTTQVNTGSSDTAGETTYTSLSKFRYSGVPVDGRFSPSK